MTDVTVVIPARNVADTIGAALQSVLAEDLVAEVIVVDDGSTDDTCARVAAFADARIQVLPGPCQGIAAALNTGIFAATAPYLARCDGDDLLQPGALTWQAAFLDTHPEYIAVSGGYASLSPDGHHLADLSCNRPAGEVTATLLGGRPVTHFCTWLTRRTALQGCGGARPFFETGEDVDLQFRLAETGRVWHEPNLVYRYRLHGGSVTHGEKHKKANFFFDTAVAFAAQRAETGADDLDRGQPPEFSAQTARPPKPHPLRAQMVGHLTGQAWRDFQQGHLRAGLRRLMLAIRFDPVNLKTWKSFLSYLLKLAQPSRR